jgi:hypothetical protein
MESNAIVAPNQYKMNPIFGFGQWLWYSRWG